MDIYLIIVFILFALAISDLIVGVSNDAVNFLNSAIGSKVAPRNVILVIASLGIIAGATFSNGMMEVARKGIFHPQHFYFTEIMVIFLAVMLTDILLLDFFNTIGLPTSTTVSIVFELLGAAVAVAVLKIVNNPDSLGMSEYINTGKALLIISGILLSVAVAFTVGLIVQWFSRLIFSFKYQKPIRYFGAIWGGIAITSITYFILIKGAKGASFMTPEMKEAIKLNTMLIIGISFAFWTIVMQLMNWIFKTNILKVVVLAGTFALAMAFAGNDLVNFIGVPLAGFESFKIFQNNGGNDMLMAGLAGKVKTDGYLLIVAGFIMVITLWLSKKARSVTETELNLSRQDEGNERFGSSFVARLLVRRAVNSSLFFEHVLPKSFVNKFKKRFDRTEEIKRMNQMENPPMFDLIRASVNLTVASILISFATSLKLPLSTTYVTFMVAMGTSLADGAWGRDSAVYRITGVFAVIGGWFMTALVAFTVAFVIAAFISWANIFAIVILLIFAGFALYKTHRVHKKREEAKKQETTEEEINTADKVLLKSQQGVSYSLTETVDVLLKTIKALTQEDRKELKKQQTKALEFNKKVKSAKNKLHKTVAMLQQDSIETSHFYVQVLDYQRELAHCVNYIVEPVFNHVDNKHKAILPEQGKELDGITNDISGLLIDLQSVIKDEEFSKLSAMIEKQEELLAMIKKIRKAQIKRIKNKEVGTRNSMLYLNILMELRNLLLYVVNMIKAQRDFVQFTKGIE